MVYKVKNPKRKYGRKRYPAKGDTGMQNAMAVAKHAYRGYKFLKGLINTEKKFFDTAISQSVSSTGIVLPMTLIAQGTDNVNRLGDSFLLKSLLIRLTVTNNATASPGTICRALLFHDVEQTGTLPAVSDVLDGSSTVSPLNKVNGKRFIIIKDWFFNMNPVSIPQVVMDYYYKCNHHVKFKTNGSNQASQGEMSVYLLLISDQPTNTPGFVGSCRLRFIDN